MKIAWLFVGIFLFFASTFVQSSELDCQTNYNQFHLGVGVPISSYDGAISCANLCSESSYLWDNALECYNVAHEKLGIFHRIITSEDIFKKYGKSLDCLTYEVDSNAVTVLENMLIMDDLGPKVMEKSLIDSNLKYWNYLAGVSAFNCAKQMVLAKNTSPTDYLFDNSLTDANYSAAETLINKSIIYLNSSGQFEKEQEVAVFMGKLIYQSEASKISIYRIVNFLSIFLSEIFKDVKFIFILIIYPLVLVLLFFKGPNFRKWIVKKIPAFGKEKFFFLDPPGSFKRISSWEMTKFIATLWIGVTIGSTFLISYWSIIFQSISINGFATQVAFSINILHHIAFLSNYFLTIWYLWTLTLGFSFIWLLVSQVRAESSLVVFKYWTYLLFYLSVFVIFSIPIFFINILLLLMFVFSFCLVIPVFWLIFVHHNEGSRRKIILVASGEKVEGELIDQSEFFLFIKRGPKLLSVDKRNVSYYVSKMSPKIKPFELVKFLNYFIFKLKKFFKCVKKNF